MRTLKFIGMLVFFAGAFVVLFIGTNDQKSPLYVFYKYDYLPLVLFFLFATAGAFLWADLMEGSTRPAAKALPPVAVPSPAPVVAPAARPAIPLPPPVVPVAPVAVADKPSEVTAAPVSAELQELRQALEARAKEAVDFKNAIEKKNREIEALRAGQNRSDLKEINEAIAGLLQSVEFFKQRLAAQKDTLENLLPQVEEAIGDVLERAKLIKGLPEAGQRLADQPVDSCTIFNRVPAPTPEQKGQIVEVRNSWVGFKVDQRLVIVSPSRIAVYV